MHLIHYKLDRRVLKIYWSPCKIYSPFNHICRSYSELKHCWSKSSKRANEMQAMRSLVQWNLEEFRRGCLQARQTVLNHGGWLDHWANKHHKYFKGLVSPSIRAHLSPFSFPPSPSFPPSLPPSVLFFLLTFLSPSLYKKLCLPTESGIGTDCAGGLWGYCNDE